MYLFPIHYSADESSGAQSKSNDNSTTGGDSKEEGGAGVGSSTDEGSAGGGASQDESPASSRKGGNSSTSSFNFRSFLDNHLAPMDPPSFEPGDEQLTRSEMLQYQKQQKQYEAYNGFREDIAKMMSEGIKYGDGQVFKLATEEDAKVVLDAISKVSKSSIIPADLIMKSVFSDRMVEEAYNRGKDDGKASMKGTRADDKAKPDGKDNTTESGKSSDSGKKNNKQQSLRDLVLQADPNFMGQFN